MISYAPLDFITILKDLMTECERMQWFHHPNVMSLIRVCIDTGAAPYIVMPFMANGSLLAYLRKERPHFTVTGAGNKMVHNNDHIDSS